MRSATFWATVIDFGESSGTCVDTFEVVVWNKDGTEFTRMPLTLLGGDDVVVHQPKT